MSEHGNVRRLRPVEALKATIASDLEGEPDPEEFVIDRLIPKGELTLFAGASNLGKSFAMLMMQVSCALGKAWFGREVRRCRSLAIYTEEPERHLWRRRNRICEYYESFPEDLDDSVSWVDRSYQGKVIYRCKNYAYDGKPTDFWMSIEESVQRYGQELLILDNASTVFDGTSQQQIRSFVEWLIDRAEQLMIAIVLLHHPPKDKTSYYAGSAAWERSCRNSFSMERPRRIDADAPWWADDGERVLIGANNNYLAHDDPMRRQGLALRWEDGVLVTRPPVAGRLPLTGPERAELDGKTFALIAKGIQRGLEIAADPIKRASFPQRMMKRKDWADAYTVADVTEAVGRLIDDGRLRVEKGLLDLPK